VLKENAFLFNLAACEVQHCQKLSGV